MKSNNKINLIIFISFLFFLFSSCNTKDNEIQRKRLLIAPFLKGAKLNYFAWSPTSSSLEADKSRGSFVESVNFDNLSITLNSDSTFIIEKTVTEYRPEFSPNTELISRKGTYSFFEDKLVLNQPIYFPEKANLANVDINIRPKKTQTEVWKQINSLVLQYIDAIEISDKENMYLRTAWVSQSFNSGIIRTRIIIKTQGDQQFAVKLVSEKAEPGSRVTDDEKFIPLDRVLSKYAKIIDEYQSRL